MEAAAARGDPPGPPRGAPPPRVSLLDSHRGRDSLLRTLSHAARLAGGLILIANNNTTTSTTTSTSSPLPSSSPSSSPSLPSRPSPSSCPPSSSTSPPSTSSRPSPPSSSRSSPSSTPPPSSPPSPPPSSPPSLPPSSPSPTSPHHPPPAPLSRAALGPALLGVSEELGRARVALRLLGHADTLRGAAAYRLGQPHEDPLLRALSVLSNCADCVYVPMETGAWASDLGLLLPQSVAHRLWGLSAACWAIGLALGLARS
ncbi:peroxisomal membrane protein 11C [Lampetra fluviatilis]